MTGMDAMNFFGVSPATPTFPLDPGGRVGASGSVAEAAKNFEAMLLTQMLKQMRESLSDEGLFSGDSADVHGGLFDFYLGRHLADAGGVGVAESLLRHVESGRAIDEPERAGGGVPGAPVR